MFPLSLSAQDFTNLNDRQVNALMQKHNMYLVDNYMLEGLNQQQFDLFNYTSCELWVIENDKKRIEIAFHPVHQVIFLQTTTLKSTLRRNIYQR
jgi:hypothetical protein